MDDLLQIWQCGWRCLQVLIAALQKDRNPFPSHWWCKGCVNIPHPLQGKDALLSLGHWWRRFGLIFLNIHWSPLETRECLNSSLHWASPGSNGFQKAGRNHSWEVQLFLTWLQVCARDMLFSRFKNACTHPFKTKTTNSTKRRLSFSSHSKFTVPTFSFKFWMLGLLMLLSCSSTWLAFRVWRPSIASVWFLVYSEYLTTAVVPLVLCSASSDTSKCFLMLLMASIATEIGFSTDCILIAFNSCIYFNSGQMVSDRWFSLMSLVFDLGHQRGTGAVISSVKLFSPLLSQLPNRNSYWSP